MIGELTAGTPLEMLSGVPSFTGGSARSKAITDAINTTHVTQSSPFIFGGSGQGVRQDGAVSNVSSALMVGAVMVGIFLWFKK